MKMVATIEARMFSSRMPGKSLMDIAGKPLLGRVIDRIRLCKKIGDIIVATSINPLDDAIEAFAMEEGVRCYRGSEEDVLLRVVEAAESAGADVTVQFCGDCPFIDWKLVDELIRVYLENEDADMVTNCLELTYPLGIYSYVVPMPVLRNIEKHAKAADEREDTVRYLWEHPREYKLINIKAPEELCRPDLRLTVDYKEDLELARIIYERLFPAKPDFTTIDIIRFLDNNPELKTINHGLIQKSAPHIKAPLER